MRRLFSYLVCLVLMGTTLNAQERSYLGHGRLFTNDLFGDGDDRWRSGSYQSSRFWGPTWAGRAPQGFGQLLEFRFGAEIVSPEDISRVRPGDRPFAGILSFGLHTHFMSGGFDNSVGADLAVTGSQTGLDDFQSFLHDVLDADDLGSGVRDGQVGNDIYPSLLVESGRRIDLAGNTRLRPFVEGRLGLENLIRAGVDLTIGSAGQEGLMIRDSVTGQRYRAMDDGFLGAAFVLGADMAYVDDSELLPSGAGVTAKDKRSRVRAGMHWQSRKGFGGFYGLTWLDKEFEGQREGQLVGSVRLNLSF